MKHPARRSDAFMEWTLDSPLFAWLCKVDGRFGLAILAAGAFAVVLFYGAIFVWTLLFLTLDAPSVVREISRRASIGKCVRWLVTRQQADANRAASPEGERT